MSSPKIRKTYGRSPANFLLPPSSLSSLSSGNNSPPKTPSPDGTPAVISSLSSSMVPTIVRSPVKAFDTRSCFKEEETSNKNAPNSSSATTTTTHPSKKPNTTNGKKRKKKFIPSRRITASPSTLDDTIPTIKINRLTAPPTITDEILTLTTPPDPSSIPKLEALCSTRMPEILSSSNLDTLITYFLTHSPSSLLSISSQPSALRLLNRHKLVWKSLPPTEEINVQIITNMLKITPESTLTPDKQYTSHIQFLRSGTFQTYALSLQTLPTSLLRSSVISLLNDCIAGDYTTCCLLSSILPYVEEKELLCTATHECKVNCEVIKDRLLTFLEGDFDGLLMGLNIVNNVYEMIENFTGPVVEKIRGVVEDAKVGELRKLLETGEGEFGEKEKENLMIAGTGSISLGLYVLFQRSNGEEVNSDEVVKTLVAFVNFMEEYVGAVSAGVMSGVVKLIQNLRGEEEKVKVEEVEVKEEVVEAGELLNQTLKEEKEGLLKEVKEELEEFEWVKTEDE